MAIFQNPKITELEMQVKQLITERDDLQRKLGNMQYENQRLNSRITAYVKDLQEQKDRLSLVSIPIHNARGAGRKPIASADDISFILDLYNQGSGITKVLKALDGRFSKSTIYRIIKKSLSQN